MQHVQYFSVAVDGDWLPIIFHYCAYSDDHGEMEVADAFVDLSCVVDAGLLFRKKINKYECNKMVIIKKTMKIKTRIFCDKLNSCGF